MKKTQFQEFVAKINKQVCFSASSAAAIDCGGYANGFDRFAAASPKPEQARALNPATAPRTINPNVA